MGVTGYRLYLGGSQVGTSLSTSYVFSGLTCGTSYTLGVAAVDAAGNVSGTATIAAAAAACSPPPPGSCTTTISSGLAAAIQNASAGATICLNSGSYGNLSFTNLSKSSDVTVKPAAGASVTIGAFNFQNVNHLHFTGQGGTMNLGGSAESYLDANSGTPCSNHVTFDYLRFTYQIEIHPRCSFDQALLIDHDNLNNLGQFEARITVIGPWPNDPTADQGLTISNSTFNGGCSKGIQFLGDSMGAQVLHNEFANLSQSGCDPIHIGGIQLYGTEHVLLKGNYFHDNGDSAGGLSIVYDGTYDSVIEDNVWVCTCIYPWSIQAGMLQNTIVRHNTFAGGGGIHFQHDGTAPFAHGNHIYDNVFTDPTNAITDSSGADWGTEDHNLNSGLAGIGDITGTPVWTGGSKPTSYGGYHLAPASPGKSAASDGTDIGIH